MRFDEEFKRKYPHLAEELERGVALRVSINGVRTSLKEAEKAASGSRAGEPTAVDYIRCCETEEQALEIIDYLERRGEIEPGYARSLREQVMRFGLRSLGPKREPGF